MAMNKKQISASLASFLISLHESPTADDIKKIKKYSDGLSSWLIESVMSAEVVVQPGQTVVTAGSPTAQTGTTTSPGQGSII